MKIKYFSVFLLLISLLSANVISAQKVKRADKDFDRYKFIDAREVYLKVVEDGYGSAQIYENLGDTYYWNSDYDNAAKWYGKLINEFSEETSTIYFYRAAQAAKSNNNSADSDKFMKLYLEKGGDPSILKATYTEFIEFDARLDKVSANSSYSDFGPSYYKDKVVFSSSVPGGEGEKIHKWNNQPFTDLYLVDVNEDGDLANPRALVGDVNTRYHETSPAFTKDGKTMYFTRNNFIDGKKGKDDDKTLRLKIYKATNYGDNKWIDVVELPFNSDEYSTAHPTLSPDEKRLYFVSERPGGFGLSDLWYVDIMTDATFSEPKNLGSDINTVARESFPFISENNNLYFSSDGRSGFGGYDIFKVPIKENGDLGTITNLGEPTNSPMDDFGFILDEAKHIGYMSSNRSGNEGSIDDEIYIVREQCEITLNGKVFDVDTEELLEGALVTLSDENNEVITSTVVGGDALFSFTAECEQKYTIRATKDNYEPFERFIQTENKTGVIDVPAPLKKIDPCPENDLGCRLTLLPIYFDFDKSNIRPDAAVELAKILAAMRTYPSLVIHIESHTDSRAPGAYNIQLSNRRAQSTMKWLVDQGVDPNRLTAEGYGETQLVNGCSDGVECTEVEHQLNRRSMFIIK